MKPVVVHLPVYVFCRDCNAVVRWFTSQNEIVCHPGGHIIATFHTSPPAATA